MLFLKIIIKNNKLLSNIQKNKFLVISTLIILTSISEWLGIFLNGKPLWTRPLHIFVKTLELSIAPIIPIICSDIIGKIQYKKLGIVAVILPALLEVVSAFTGFIFTVSPNNIYQHASFYWIYTLSFVLGILCFLYTTLKASKQLFGFNRILILLLPIFLLFGLAFQYIGDNIHVIWLCVAIDVVFMYTIYIEYTQNLDSLTHTLNRKYYENTLARLSVPSFIFFFDVNEFKSVNDTYGHVYGDTTLSKVGQLLISTFSQDGECFRIGGDEFCVILQDTHINPDTFLNKLNAKVIKEKKLDPRFPWIAVGYAKYHPNDNVDQVIAEADKQMYENKLKIKSQA